LSIKNFAIAVSRNLIYFFVCRNDVTILANLKFSIMGFVTEILKTYFLKLPYIAVQ